MHRQTLWVMRIVMILLAPLLFTSSAGMAEPAPPIYSPPDPANWGHDFYWASEAARGRALCNPELREEFENRFDRRYGPRFRRLEERYQALFGTPPEFAVVSVCRRVRGNVQRERTRHRRAISQFEHWIDAAEAQIAQQ